MGTLTALERIKKARIQLYKKNPFFSYLTMKLQLKELPKEQAEHMRKNGSLPTACVDNFGNFYYDEDFIQSLSEEEVLGLTIHEVSHIIYEHLGRLQNRDMELWNVATDLAINNILVNNGFQLPKANSLINLFKKINPKIKVEDIICLIPNNNEIELPIAKGKKILIKDLDKKGAERIYDEIYNKLPKDTQDRIKNGRFDIHIYLKKGDGKGKGNISKDGKGGLIIEVGEKEFKELSKKWKETLVEASVIARQRGNMPLGMERLIGELTNEKVNWRAILSKFINREMIQDYSYATPSKRSQTIGVYMPSFKRENIEVIVSVDVSGSISQKELTDFLTEIVGISRSFNHIKITCIIFDCEIKNVIECSNGSIQEILDTKIIGGGGTSHLCVYDWIKENKSQAKILINLTDAYTEFPKEESIKTIWVICKGGVDDDKIPFGEIIRMED